MMAPSKVPKSQRLPSLHVLVLEDSRKRVLEREKIAVLKSTMPWVFAHGV
jgi:hypothetical protein